MFRWTTINRGNWNARWTLSKKYGFQMGRARIFVLSTGGKHIHLINTTHMWPTSHCVCAIFELCSFARIIFTHVRCTIWCFSRTKKKGCILLCVKQVVCRVQTTLTWRCRTLIYVIFISSRWSFKKDIMRQNSAEQKFAYRECVADGLAWRMVIKRCKAKLIVIPLCSQLSRLCWRR